MSTTSTSRTFFTREGKIEFQVQDNIAISDSSFIELITKASRLPKDEIVLLSGIDIRDSLTVEEKKTIIDLIGIITKNDADYCLENRIVTLSKHIVEDYLLGNPAVLLNRGWASVEPKLVNQVINTLINVMHVEKAQINFRKNGLNKTPITYTIVGNDNGTIRRLSIMIQPKFTPHGEEKKVIVAATVLHTN